MMPASEIHVVREENAEDKGAEEARGGCSTPWGDDARQGKEDCIESFLVTICSATLHLSQYHVADLGQGSSQLDLIVLHSSFGLVKTHPCHRFIISPIPHALLTDAPALSRASQYHGNNLVSPWTAHLVHLPLIPHQMCSSSPASFFAPPEVLARNTPTWLHDHLRLSPFEPSMQVSILHISMNIHQWYQRTATPGLGTNLCPGQCNFVFMMARVTHPISLQSIPFS